MTMALRQGGGPAGRWGVSSGRNRWLRAIPASRSRRRAPGKPSSASGGEREHAR